jgi:PAS domain S-box-containing protein
LLDSKTEEARFPVVMMTSYGDEQMAVDVMKAGALDYIVKMDATFDDLPHVVQRVLREWANLIGRKRAELVHAVLYEISEVANSDVGLEEVYRSIHRNIGRLIDVKNFYIALYDADAGMISLPYFVDELDSDNSPYKFGKGLTEQVLLSGKPLMVNETESAGLARQGTIEIVGPPAKIWLGVPLKSGKKTFGVLAVQHYTHIDAYNEKDKDMLVFVSDQIAAVIGRRQAERALKGSEKKYRMLFNSMMDAFAFHEAVYDNKGMFVDYRYVEVNPMYEKFIGLKREELIGKSVRQLFPDSGQQWIDIYSKVIKTGEHVRFEFYHEEQGKYYEVNAYQPEPDTFATILSDISQRKKAEIEKLELEEKIINLEKMEAVGVLAGGVAHDLNNVLGAVVSYPDLLLMKLPEDSSLRKPIQTMQQSGLKAAAIVQDMLTLARRGVAIKDIVDLRDVLTNYLLSPEYEKLRKYHPNLQVEADFGTDLLNVEGSFLHIGKTVMNLVSNAAEAMPKGGKISISLQNHYIERELSGYDLNIKEGDYVVLTVSDNGMGISDKDIKRIFEPFYTKKEMGRSGTGLGMTVVWGTVKDHGGYINVTSSEEDGSCFELYFPATRKAVSAQKTGMLIEDYIGNGEKILVVDDVGEQREIASALLTTLAYTVDTAINGEAAIEYMKNGSADLVLLDMIMDPGIDGLDTYKGIIKVAPNIKTIIASGFSETERVREAQKLGAGAYIKKPYTLEKIGLAVKAELSK